MRRIISARELVEFIGMIVFILVPVSLWIYDWSVSLPLMIGAIGTALAMFFGAEKEKEAELKAERNKIIVAEATGQIREGVWVKTVNRYQLSKGVLDLIDGPRIKLHINVMVNGEPQRPGMIGPGIDVTALSVSEVHDIADLIMTAYNALYGASNGKDGEDFNGVME